MEKTLDRQPWIDIYKGIAIILVVLGHLEIPKALYDFIFLFHMYAFFFISGITFRVKEKQSFGAFLWDNVKRLYVPYLFFAFAWDVVHIVTSIYLQGSFDLSLGAIVRNICSVLIGGGPIQSNANIGAAWFLLALFVVRLVCWMIVKLTKDNRFFFGAVSAVLFLMGYICTDASILPFKIGSTLTAFIFVFLGYSLKNMQVVLRKWKGLSLLATALISFVVVAVISALTDRTVTLVGNILPSNCIYTIVGGVCGCAGLMLLSMVLERVSKVSDCLAFFGVNSLIIMGVHSEINFALRFVFEKIGLGQLYRVLIIFIMTLLLSVPICWIVNKYFPILTGKRKSNV